MKNGFESLFSGKKQKDDKKTAAVENKKPEEEAGLEKARTIKNDIWGIVQGRSLEDLELGDLQNVLAEYKKMKKVLGIPETEPRGDVREQMERAKEIMGSDFFAEQEIEKAFGIKVEADKIPEIPFTKEDLERAKELNQFLVLRVDKAPDGKPLTIAKMNELLKGKVKDGAKALYADDGSGKIKDDAWYKNEDFANKEAPKLSWALASKEVISNSPNKNYLDQTVEIANYLKNEVFKGKEIPAEFQSAISEFEKAKGEIATILKDDWKKAAEKLEKLAITKLTRQTPVEALYDLLIYFQNKDEKLLSGMYNWTSRRDSDGGLVPVGSFDSGGVSVARGAPDASNDGLGVSFSRSL
jgi:hypothetical protein